MQFEADPGGVRAFREMIEAGVGRDLCVDDPNDAANCARGCSRNRETACRYRCARAPEPAPAGLPRPGPAYRGRQDVERHGGDAGADLDGGPAPHSAATAAPAGGATC
jgi:hypothetical protein